jgi:NADH-quinone oxidoreductase subunit E
MSNFSQTLKFQIDNWVNKYPCDQKQSAILPALRLIQEENGGWLNDTLLREAADYLNMPYIAVYEVATFYSMFELKPVGKHKLCVCTNISCMLAGSDEIVAHLQQKLGLRFGETSADGKFTLKEVECLGACANAPVIHIGHEYHEDLTAEKVDELLERLK